MVVGQRGALLDMLEGERMTVRSTAGLILLGLSPIFWYGFALPLGPLLGVAQLVLLILVWRTLG